MSHLILFFDRFQAEQCKNIIKQPLPYRPAVNPASDKCSFTPFSRKAS